MSNIWNPHAFGVTGQPVGPQVNTLRVYGAEPSKEQLAMAQQTFAKFCMTERLSFAANQTQQGFLPDGSKYRIVVVGNTRIMEVRVESSEDVYEGLEMANGLLRYHGYVFPDDFDNIAIKELKETGATSYVNTQKLLFRKKPDTVLDGTAGRMFTDGTGLTKKFLQFLRGASASYTKYFNDIYKLPIGSMYLGNGVVVFERDGKKRAFVYSFNTMSDVRAIEMKILPTSQVVKGSIPTEINNIFGGCPMPPTEDEWYKNSYTVLYSSAIDSVVGNTRTAYLHTYNTDDLLGPRAGTAFSLPPMSVTDDGLSIYFVAGWRKDDEPFRPLYSRPVRLDFGVVELSGKYFLTASATAIQYEGIADYIPGGVWSYRPGTTKGIVAVGIFNGTPTFFEVEREAHTWHTEVGEQTENTKIKVNISGGINEECVIYNEDIFTLTHEAGACSASISRGLTTDVWTASVKEKVRVRGGSVKIVTGTDGAIQITKAHMDSYISYDADVNATSITIHETASGTSSASTSGSVVVLNPGVPEIHHKKSWDMHPIGTTGEFVGKAPGFADYTYGPEDNWKLQVIEGLLPQYTAPPTSASGYVTFGLQNIVVDSTTIYAGNAQYNIDTLSVLNEFETDGWLNQIKESRAFLYVDPLYLVRTHYADFSTVRPEMWYEFSWLGQENVIAHYNAWNWNASEAQDREMNYGPHGAGDDHYPNKPTYFVGKT